MKPKICILFLFLAGNVVGQELPRNPQTGLIFIKDSIELKNQSAQEVQDILIKWGFTLLDEGNLSKVYKLDNSKQTEKLFINLPLGSVLTQDQGGNRFVANGTLTYSKTKTKGFMPTASFGGIRFDFSYVIAAGKLVYEFTNTEYSPDLVHYGKFEAAKPPSDNYNKSLLFKMSKKEWDAVRLEYFNNLKILAANLKEYSANFLQRNQDITKKSPINYESYKKIAAGMSYDEVKNILGNEGKEQSNNTSTVSGKSAIQQSIIWYHSEADKSKYIMIVFVDNKVSSKNQSNL